MKIKRYNHILLEKNLINLMLESKIYYLSDFKELLKKIKGNISSELMSILNTDVDVQTNYIGLTDKDDTIKFYPDSKVNIDKIRYRI